jgi:hypothetical protein
MDLALVPEVGGPVNAAAGTPLWPAEWTAIGTIVLAIADRGRD